MCLFPDLMLTDIVLLETDKFRKIADGNSRFALLLGTAWFHIGRP
jgi:hypothetical protein